MNSDTKNKVIIYHGSIGVAIAVALSYSINKSILWAMLHGFLSWFYVVYFACVHN